MSMDLNQLRANIDNIDEKIVALINERYHYVHEVGKWKNNKSSAIYVPEREKTLLERLEKINHGRLKPETLRAIYREIMSGAIALEKPIMISYLGPEASFTQLAALGKFGHSVEYQPRHSIDDVFNDIESERVEYGCVPIENSTEGTVNHTLDRFVNSSVHICSEINMRIHHSFMANCKFSEVKKIYSHAQVFGQCRNWLQENMPGVELVEFSSTTKAAHLASVEKDAAAIASVLAAEKYSLNILRDNIEDSSDNTTRFMIISKQDTKSTGNDKTSICFAIKDKVGGLYECLIPFKNQDLTLTMIESRPSKKKNWEYTFFVDVLGHISEDKVQKAIEELEDICQYVNILGSYPRNSIIL